MHNAYLNMHYQIILYIGKIIIFGIQGRSQTFDRGGERDQ